MDSDGVLRKRWEIHCPICEIGQLDLISTDKHDAEAELRRIGWEVRRGLWRCPSCKDEA